VWRTADAGHMVLHGLEPPEPMVAILQTIDGGEVNTAPVAHLDREPIFLYPKLEVGMESRTADLVVREHGLLERGHDSHASRIMPFLASMFVTPPASGGTKVVSDLAGAATLRMRAVCHALALAALATAILLDGSSTPKTCTCAPASRRQSPARCPACCR